MSKVKSIKRNWVYNYTSVRGCNKIDKKNCFLIKKKNQVNIFCLLIFCDSCPFYLFNLCHSFSLIHLCLHLWHFWFLFYYYYSISLITYLCLPSFCHPFSFIHLSRVSIMQFLHHLSFFWDLSYKVAILNIINLILWQIF